MSKKAQRSTGLMEFLGSLRSGAPTEDALPVVCAASGRGRVASAFVSTAKPGFLVRGTVRRTSGSEPRSGAHVDVLLYDSHGKLMEGESALYSPRMMPHRRRGSIAQSHFHAQIFTAKPPAGSWVKAVFHDAPITDCQFTHES